MSLRSRARNRAGVLASVAAGLSVAWLIAILLLPGIRFVVLAPTAKLGIEVVLALGSLFSALVLFLFPTEGARQRLRWIAAGFLILGLGGLLFGYLEPLISETGDVNRARYASLVIQSGAGAFFVAGLLPTSPWPVSTRQLLFLVIAGGALAMGGYLLADRLPSPNRLADLDAATRHSSAIMPGLTAWHWVLSLVPLAFAIGAVIGSVRWAPHRAIGDWLVIAMTLRTGAQLHAMFWPSGYSPVLTTASVLRMASTLLIVAGAMIALDRIAAERDALLAAEREYTRRMHRLGLLRADFTAMVTHELGTPIAAIRRLAEIAKVGTLQPHQEQALDAIGQEIEMLTTLVGDVQASTTIERDEFAVRLAPVPLQLLLADAEAYATTLPGAHQLVVTGGMAIQVLADQERISQVLRNLLSNAVKYSPDGTPIELRAALVGRHIQLEVVDQGYGIHPDDLERVFEKFGRGRDLAGRPIAGVGLGLYLSRRIAQAHGSDLHLAASPGGGTVVSFTLSVAHLPPYPSRSPYG